MRERVFELLQGAIDFHVHLTEDPFVAKMLNTSPERSSSLPEAIEGAKKLGMKGFVLKAHDYPTAPISRIAKDIDRDFEVIGGITLNYGVGGINPYAVEICGRMGGRVLWMPTFSSRNEMERRGMEGGIYLLDDKGELKKEVREVLSLVREFDMVLSTAHIKKEEIYALVKGALNMGIKKILITHPLTKIAGTYLSVDEQKELSEMGAFIEHCFAALMPGWGTHPDELLKAIKEVGAQRCILSTDLGQLSNPVPWEGMRMMVSMLLSMGLPEREINLLIKENPRRLLE